MSENIASSTWFGARPSLSRTSAYSLSVSPSARASSSVGADKAHRPEDQQAVVGARERVDGVLGMGHEPEDVARLVADARDVPGRPVVVRGVAEDDLVGDRVEVGRVV